jgi:hypothetical protein
VEWQSLRNSGEFLHDRAFKVSGNGRRGRQKKRQKKKRRGKRGTWRILMRKKERN